MCEPIFVVGRHRSGTTWLSNLLAAHYKIYTPQHSDHYGQHESAYFTSLIPYCRWGRDENDRLAIKAIFERSDFWHLLFPTNPPILNIERLGLNGYFENAMAEACRRRDARYWLEKTPAHTLILAHLMHAYPNAIFIAVERNILDTVRSNVYKFSNPSNPLHWAKAAAWCVIYRKSLIPFKEKVYLIRYEELVNDTESTLWNIGKWIGIDLCTATEMSKGEWTLNSSYESQPPKTPIHMRLVTSGTVAVLNLLPACIYNKTMNLWLLKRAGRRLPAWFFRVYRGIRSPAYE